MKQSETDVPSTEGPQNMNQEKEWPFTPNHHDFLEKIEEVLEEKDKEFKRGKLAEEIEKLSDISLKKSTMKAWLSTHRKYIEENTAATTVIDRSKDHDGGDPARFWRLDR